MKKVLRKIFFFALLLKNAFAQMTNTTISTITTTTASQTTSSPPQQDTKLDVNYFLTVFLPFGSVIILLEFFIIILLCVILARKSKRPKPEKLERLEPKTITESYAKIGNLEKKKEFSVEPSSNSDDISNRSNDGSLLYGSIHPKKYAVNRSYDFDQNGLNESDAKYGGFDRRSSNDPSVLYSKNFKTFPKTQQDYHYN